MLDILNKACALFLRWIGRVSIPKEANFLKDQVAVAIHENRKWLNQPISQSLVHILVVAEDKRFWRHGGVDLVAVMRAIYQTIVRRRIQGGSTIEQQLVRTLTGYREFSVRRKVREMILACMVKDFITKREVAVLYLCCAYYGWRMNSLAEASVRMEISVTRVGAKESAELVARLKYPEPHFSSVRWRALIDNRVRFILQKVGDGKLP